jgi:hypothetical protein
MQTVFISGSITIKHLNNKVLARVDNIIDTAYRIVVGDAGGVDSAIQQYLLGRNYKNVVVYCSGKAARNNRGAWPIKAIESAAPPGTRAFFTAKDLSMAEDCDYGLMVWDAASTGTLSNVIELLKRDKSSLVYSGSNHTFFTIKDFSDLDQLLSIMKPSDFAKADKKLKLADLLESFKYQQAALL